MSSPVQPPLRVETVDGTTSGRPITTIKVTNGDLTISGSTATIDTSGGGGGSGTVTSVGLTETGTALTITGSPVTTSGTINIAGAGTSSQVILGDLSLGTLTTGTIGGSISSTQVARGATTADEIEGDNGLLFDGTSFTINTLSANDPVINMSSSTKSLTLEVNTSQKLSVKGSSDSFVFDASSATGGITWPDSTTQITANNSLGTVTSITAGDGLSGGTITGTGTISIPDQGGVAAGSYTSSDITVDARGIITAISSGGGGGVTFPIEADSGSAGVPSYSFSADTDTGIYLSGASNMGIVAGSNSYLSIGSLGAVQFDRKALFNVATAAAPNGFATDTNTGFFQAAADTISLSNAGSETFRFGSSGEILIGGSAAGTSGQVLTSGGSGAAASWTTVSAGGAKPSIATSVDSAYDMYMLTSLPPFTRGVLTSSSQTIGTSPIFIPFLAPTNITGVAFEVNITGIGLASNLLMCLYEASTVTGSPTTKVTNSEVTIDATSTGYKTATFSSTIGLTNNTVYWIALCSNNNTITLRAHSSDQQMPVGLINGMDNFNKAIIQDTVASGSLPASSTDANLETSYIFAPLVGLQV